MNSFLFRSTILWTALALLRSFAAPGGADAAEKINASYGAISGSMAPIWVAKEARLFDKQGLDLNLVYIPGGPRSIMSLIGNSIQFVNHSGMPALEAYQRGADTVMIASSMNQLEHAVMAEKSITSVDQLKGKVLGISAPGALTDIILREALRFHGISEKEVTIIPVGDEGARLSSLQTGRVQAVIISGIQRRTAARLGFRQVIDLAKLPIEVSGSSIQVRRSYLAQNPEITLKFLKAWIEGGFLFKAKPEFSIGVLKKYVANQDPEVLNAIYELNKQQLSTKPVPYVRVVKSMMQLLARTRPDLPNVNPKGFIEPRFINELEKAGFFEEMTRQYGK
jgi:ABC-type nitrate/sulfonate/bicarbonate transport system substrate-binding protein